MKGLEPSDGTHVADADACGAALLLIDVINPMSFPGSEELVERARPMAKRLALLKAEARRARLPTIYVNDNFGKWRSDFRTIVAHCAEDGIPGAAVTRELEPDAEDYFVLKPKHSGFYGTALDVLLDTLGTRRLVITGVAGNICVLFTANDAYMRDFELFVPSDCVASNTDADNRHALDQMKRFLHADIRPWTELDLREIARGGRASPSRVPTPTATATAPARRR